MKDLFKNLRRPWSWFHRCLRSKNEESKARDVFRFSYQKFSRFFQIFSFELSTPEDIENQLK